MGARRRLVLALFACLVLGASTVLGTTAFSTASMEREATVSVATDRNAAVGLVDGHPGGGLVEQSARGTLILDFARDEGAGANREAVFRLGAGQLPSVTDDHAFRIINRGTQTRSLTLRYALASGSGDGDPAKRNVRFLLFYDGDGDGAPDSVESVSEQSSEGVTVPSVAPSENVYVSVVVDTRGLEATSDLTGTLNVYVGGEEA
jgi:hypothetical protein